MVLVRFLITGKLSWRPSLGGDSSLCANNPGFPRSTGLSGYPRTLSGLRGGATYPPYRLGRYTHHQTCAAAAKARAKAKDNTTVPLGQRGYQRHRRIRSTTTRANYMKQHLKFVAAKKLTKSLLVDRDRVDIELAEHIDQMYASGELIFTARCAVYGTAWVLAMPLKDPNTLHLSREALKGWSVVTADRAKEAIPDETAVLLALQIMERGPTGMTAARALWVSIDG
jgi:hypothetical protein